MKVLLLIFPLIFWGCKGKGEKEENPETATKTNSPSEERLNRIRAYVATEKEIYIINLAQNTFKKLNLTSKIRDIFLSEDTIWIAGSSLFWLTDGEIGEGIELPAEYKKVIKDRTGIYVLRKDGILRLPEQRRIALSDEPIKFDVGFEKIWVMDEEGLSIYRMTDLKELYRIPLEKPLDFAITTYGIRVYIATPNRLNIFDAQTGNYITEAQIETGEQVELKFIGDKLYCLTESMLYKIDRTTNQIEKRIQIEEGEQLFVSKNGKYGAVLRDSIISFFDTEKVEITKNIKLRVVDITTTLQGSRIYCLTPEELIAISPDKLQAVSKLKLIGGKKIIIK